MEISETRRENRDTRIASARPLSDWDARKETICRSFLIYGWLRGYMKWKNIFEGNPLIF